MGFAELLLLALCHLFHLSPSPDLQARSRIVADAAMEYHIPIQILAGVCWHVSGMGTDPGYQSLCGARTEYGFPVFDDRDSARSMARNINRGYTRCGTWFRGLSYARSGWCRSPSFEPWARTAYARGQQIGREMVRPR